MARAACTLAGLLVVACTAKEIPATEVVVSVDSTIDGDDAIEHVEVELKSADGKTSGRKFGLNPKAFPFTFGIVKKTQGDFLLIVKGFAAGSTDLEHPDVEARLLGSFEDEKTLLLKVLLSSACLYNTCGGDPDRTCYATTQTRVTAGSCGAVPTARTSEVDPASDDLSMPRPFDEEEAEADGGGAERDEGGVATIRPDAGPGDAAAHDAALDGATRDSDIGVTDAGVRPDAGLVDAGTDSGAVPTAGTSERFVGIWSVVTGQLNWYSPGLSQTDVWGYTGRSLLQVSELNGLFLKIYIAGCAIEVAAGSGDSLALVQNRCSYYTSYNGTISIVFTSFSFTLDATDGRAHMSFAYTSTPQVGNVEQISASDLPLSRSSGVVSGEDAGGS